MSSESRMNPCVIALRPFQRRIRRSVFARHLPIACVVALVGADVGLLVARPDAMRAVLWGVSALVLAAAAAYVLARLRTPSLVTTAQLVDGYFTLEDRAVTALQFSNASDPVARLVVADAVSRLERISPSRLPLGVSSALGWAAVVMLAFTAWIAAGPGRREAAPEVAGGAGAGGSPLRTAPPGERRAGGRAGSAPADQGGNAGRSNQAESRIADGRQSGREDRNSTVGNDGDASGRGGDIAARPSAQAPVTTSASDQASAAASATSAGGARSSRGGDGASGAVSGVASQGRGADAVGQSVASAGGVRGGSLVPQRDSALSAPSSNRSAIDASDYRRALAQTDAAIARDRVPVRLRSYVRDYLVAIRAGQEP